MRNGATVAIDVAELTRQLLAKDDEGYEDKPETSQMRMWADQLEGEFAGLKNEQEYEEGIYYQDYDVQDSPEGDGIKTGSAPSDCDAAVDSLTPSDMVIRVRPARSKGGKVQKKYKDQAETLQRGLKGLWMGWRRRKDILGQLAWDMVVRRVCVARLLVDDAEDGMPTEFSAEPQINSEEDQDAYEERLADWEFRKGMAERRQGRRKVPLKLERRDPRYTYWREDPSDGTLMVVVERYQTTWLEAEANYQQYPAAREVLNGKEPMDTVWITDVWKGQYRCMFIDDTPIFPVGADEYEGVVKHPYGEIPYAIASFREVPADLPGLRYRGMLTNAADLYMREGDLLTQHFYILKMMAYRTYKGHTVDGRDITMIPGLVIDLNKDRNEYLEVVEGSAVTPELLQTVAVADQYIQRNSVAQGPRSTEGTRSAQQVWAIQAQRQQKIDAAKGSFIRFAQRICYLALMEIEENLKRPLTLPVPGRDKKTGDALGEVTMGPSDILGYWDCADVSFGRRLDPALLEQNKALMTFAQNNFWPHERCIELGGVFDDPEEIMDEMLQQGIERQPWFAEFGALLEAEEYYGPNSWQYMLILSRFLKDQEQQAAASGAPPTGGPPPPGGQPGAGLTSSPMQPAGQRSFGAQQEAQGDVGSGIMQATTLGKGRAAGRTNLRKPAGVS